MFIATRGDKIYGRCPSCGKLVQANKPVFRGLHVCLTDCEKAGRHLDLCTRRRGLFRRRVSYCKACNTTVSES